MPNPTRVHTTCTLEGCNNGGYITRGLCRMHYARWRRHGDPGGAEKQHAVSWAGVPCTVAGCDREAKARGYCVPHWKRWKRWGDPLGERELRPPIERFAEKVRRGTTPSSRPGLGPCQVWTAGLAANGYGIFHFAKGQQTTAHRWAYLQMVGPIPDGYVIDHLCRNRACVNPDHLEAVTHIENLRRGAGYGLRNGMRTACIHGHTYTAENTYTDPRGGVRCRACAKNRDKNRKR